MGLRAPAWPKLAELRGAVEHPAASALGPLAKPVGSGWAATSLFCGGGGLDLGFLSAGISAGAAYDSSRAAILTYDANLPSAGRQADLARFAPDDACDVLLAGAPCQGFSTVGKHLPDDPRNALLARVGDIALRLLPKVIVVENVPAALSTRNGRLWRALEDRLRLGGYNTITMTLLGEESGLAQRRRRLFMLCWRGMNETRVEIERVEAPSLRAVLAGAEALSDHVANYPLASSAEARIARRIQPGQKLCNVRSSLNAVPTWAIPEVFGSTSNTEREVLEAVSKLRRRDRRRNYGDGDPVEPSRLDIHVGRQTGRDVMRLVDAGYLRMIDGAVELRQTYNGKYRRLSWDDLAPTVDTHYGRMTLFMHPEQNRGLSAREAARIQGFPDAYMLAGKARDHFAIIGNAVPPPMAARLATFIREALLKR